MNTSALLQQLNEVCGNVSLQRIHMPFPDDSPLEVDMTHFLEILGHVKAISMISKNSLG